MMFSTLRRVLVALVFSQALCYVHGGDLSDALLNLVSGGNQGMEASYIHWDRFRPLNKIKPVQASEVMIDLEVDSFTDEYDLSAALANEKFGRKLSDSQNKVMKREVHGDYVHTKLNRDDSGLEIFLVERSDEHQARVKRTTHILDGNSWGYEIPYVFDSTYSDESSGFYLPIVRRVLKYISNRLCVTFNDETNNYDPNNGNWFLQNGYPVNSYLSIRKHPQNSCAASRGYYNNNSTMIIYPCFGFQIILHEFLHTLGVAHSQQSAHQDNYLALFPDNFNAQIFNTFQAVDPTQYVDDDVDVESTMMYGPRTFNLNGLDIYLPTRDEEYMSDSVISREDIVFKELNQVYKCNELYCNNNNIDCGPGYYAKTYGACRCVCPRLYDEENNCQTLKNGPSTTAQWPDVPMVLFKPGANVPCPPGFTQTGSFTHKGKWTDLQKPLPDLYAADGATLTTVYEMCTKPGTSPANWELMPPGGSYCIVKPVGESCGFGAAAVLNFYSYETVVYSGGLGDSTFNDRSITLRYCCSYQGHTHMVLHNIPNGFDFRLIAKGSCPVVDGMRSYKALVDFFTDEPKSVTGGVLPQYYIFASELQNFHCYYKAAVYGCNEEVTLDFSLRSVSFQTPGYAAGARVPNKRCIYSFKGLKNSQLRLTFNDYKLDFDDKFLVQRYNVWQEPILLDYDNFPYQILSVNNELYLEWFAGYTTVSDKGVSFTVDLLPGEEAEYDPDQNGGDYVGTTSISENYEKCLPWKETIDCYDFPAGEMDALVLMTVGSSCRNPGGRLERPWCYTYKNGTNCRRRFCDVNNYKAPVDVIKDCASLVAADPTFCTDSVSRWGCFSSCNFQQAPIAGCPAGWERYGKRCYKYFNTPASQSAAQTACNNFGNGGTLFEVLREEDQQVISDYKNRNGLGSSESWISGEYDFTNLGWFTSDFPREMYYLNFPNNPECSAADWVPFKDICFKMFLDAKTGGDSRTACTTTGATGTLLRINNEEEALSIRYYKNLKGGLYTYGTWISGNINGVVNGEGDWRFSDSTIQMPYLNWTVYEVTNDMNLDCIRMYSEGSGSNAGGWRAMSCSSGGTAYYICQQDKASSFSGADYIYMGANGDWGNDVASAQKDYICQQHRAGTCSTPTIPSDGEIVGTYPTFIGTLKPYYYEGERVSIQCANGVVDPIVNDIICQPDGSWTPLAYACTDCPVGWEPMGDRCFEIRTDSQYCYQAEEICRTLGPGGTMYRIHDETEQMLLKLYRREIGSPYNLGVWISGNIVGVEPSTGQGIWHFTDSSTQMTYFNWTQFEVTNDMNLNCIRLYTQIANGAPYWLEDGWRTLNTASGGSGYVCQQDFNDVGCQDKITECEDIMAAKPEFCTQLNLLLQTWDKCYKSCGYCPGTDCSDPLSATYTRTSASSTVMSGEYMTFECNSGLYHVGGDLKRACSWSGTFLGVEPVCSASPVATDVNLNSLRPRLETLPKKYAYLMDKDIYRVPFDGNITTWYYYADEPNPELYFVVFRKSGASYTYVGSNLIPLEADWPWEYNVPLAQQIPVLQGDIVGYYSTNSYTLYASNCNGAPDQLMVSPRAYADSITQLQTASFSATECYVPSLGYRIEPPLEVPAESGGSGGGGSGHGKGGKKFLII